MAKEPVNSPDLDRPESSVLHGQQIRSKFMLREIYRENYLYFSQSLIGSPAGTRLELGSGGGFIKEIIPDVLTSDVVSLPGIDAVISGVDLPFADSSLGAILMNNVFHHIQDVGIFLAEADRCLQPGGVLCMIEPANTLFSSLVYSTLHTEPFVPDQKEWRLPKGGRMSVANNALPWIVFTRDRARFEEQFKSLKIEEIACFRPLAYLVSGGVSYPQLLPSFAYPAVRGLEWCMTPLNSLLGLFMKIRIRRI